MTSDHQAAVRGRWAVAAMFLANGFLFGSWAPQIPLLLPRHDITEFTLGLLIFGLGVGAVVAMSFSTTAPPGPPSSLSRKFVPTVGE
jgi:hypothetical protein